jgi:hypothetical protein
MDESMQMKYNSTSIEVNVKNLSEGFYILSEISEEEVYI